MNKRNPIESEYVTASQEANKDNFVSDLDSSNTRMVSETMANIYVSQGAYQEAVNAYKELLIKNPGRKEYFISKIDSLIQKVESL